MKIKLLITFLVLCLISKAQPNYSKFYGGYNYNDRVAIGGGLHIPAMGTPALYTGQWIRAGAIIYDSTGGNKGIHVWNGTTWVRMVDTTMTSFLASSITASNGLTKSASDIKLGGTLSAATLIDGGNNAFVFSGMGGVSRFAQATTGSTRRLRMVNSNGTDSAYIEVNGATIGTARQVKLSTNSTSTTSYSTISLLDAGGTSINSLVTGNTHNESVLTIDTNKVSFARRNLDGGGVYSSIVEVHTGYQDSWADDSLIWRMTNRSAEFFLERNIAAIYAVQNEIELEAATGITIEPYKQNLYIDSLQHTATATAKMVTWDSASGRIETRAIPVSGTFAPTVTGGANYASSTDMKGKYQRVGNIVTVTYSGNVTASAGSAVVVFDVTIPVASNFTDQYDASGGGAASFAGSAENVLALANTTNDRVQLTISTVGSTNARYFGITVTYEVK